MDRQYEYVSIDPFDHYGFLPYHTGDRIDPMAEERIGLHCGFRIAEFTGLFGFFGLFSLFG